MTRHRIAAVTVAALVALALYAAGRGAGRADAMADVQAQLAATWGQQWQAMTAGSDAASSIQQATPAPEAVAPVWRCADVPPSVAPPAVSRWCDAIDEAAGRWGLDPRALTVLVAIESAGNPEAVSSAGATGLTQQMPGTAEMLTASTGLPCGSKAAGVNTDPATNLACGARYLVDGMRAAATIWRAGDEAQHLGAAGIGFHDGHGVLPRVVSHWQAGGHVCEAPVSDYGRLWCRQMVDAWTVMTASPAALGANLGVVWRPRP